MEEKNLKLIKQLRHELHQHPERSNQEVWTKQHLIHFLKKHTNLKIIDCDLWFYAVFYLGKDKPNIAFRADFDALPINETINIPYASKFSGIAHKCGHDGHAASLAGLALEIDQKGVDKNIFFLFQHAEETGDGAAQCVDFIKKNNIEEIYAFHNMSGMPLNSINIIDGTAHYTSKGMTIHMEGTPSHASDPEKGSNPAFAIAKIIDVIPKLISQNNNEDDALCTVIHVNVGEKAFGLSASKGTLLLTIRAPYELRLNKLQESIENIAWHQAEKYHLNVHFSYSDFFPETRNHQESSDKIRHVCKIKGFQLIEMSKAFRVSEDFGHYLKQTKGAIFYIGNGKTYPPIHTLEYDFRDDILETAVEVFKGLARF